MTITIGSSVLTLKWCASFLVSTVGTQSIPLFSLCLWDSGAREKHWAEMNWPPRSDLKPGDPNILHELLVERKKIIFPPLHIKLGS